MIAKASILNPIRFFNDPIDNYWLTPAKNGPDRGNFFRYWPASTPVILYFSADSAIAFIDLKKCSDNSVVGSFVVTSLGGQNYSCSFSAAASTEKVYLEVRGSTPLVQSEQFWIVLSSNYYVLQQTAIQYRNVNAFAGIPAATLLTTYLNISFWQQKNPQEYEDIEITPGEFIRLTNHVHRTFKFETDYYPGYLHEMIQVMLGLDYVLINNKEWIMRNGYSYEYTNRNYALAKGTIELTERKSILRNTI